MTSSPRCRYCGGTLVLSSAIEELNSTCCPSPTSIGTDHTDFRGPAVLAQTFIFADSHLLLLRRGTPPYAGKWAPPGGFVEAHESAESAAVREIREEVGIELDVARLVPFATISLESINQIYLSFIVRLDRLIVPAAVAPEALEARWFSVEAFPLCDIWPPLESVDMSAHFDRVRAGRFEFYQRTDEFTRVISDGERIVYLRTGHIGADSKAKARIDEGHAASPGST